MTADITSLLSAAAVRERANLLLTLGLDGYLPHFLVHMDQLAATADYVVETIRQNYPSLVVPPHARWRHFVVDGVDECPFFLDSKTNDRLTRARARIELVVVSVLLDAGSGPSWRYHVARTGRVMTRSEGLAMASLVAFAEGCFSQAKQPQRADADGLIALTTAKLGAAFQVRPDNPLAGLDGRVDLLQRLGGTIAANPSLWGADQRVSGLFDRLADLASSTGNCIAAANILKVVLDMLGPIWPGRMTIDGTNLGDTWRHSAIERPGPTDHLMPFHKLSQWLTYSLIEPLEEAGITVSDLDGLTGLAEYRNGGLFVDMGVLTPRDKSLADKALLPGEEPIVEWRALTVALLDQIAPLVRARLHKGAAEMALAAILEGGTWSAGRRIARAKRADGSPPLKIISDGSVF